MASDICWERSYADYHAYGPIQLAHDWRPSLAPGLLICGACGQLRADPASDEEPHVAETVDELRRDCEHRWVMIRPSRPGPDGWAKRCKLCGAYVDISAEARAEAAAEYDERR